MVGRQRRTGPRTQRRFFGYSYLGGYSLPMSYVVHVGAMRLRMYLKRTEWLLFEPGYSVPETYGMSASDAAYWQDRDERQYREDQREQAALVTERERDERREALLDLMLHSGYSAFTAEDIADLF